MSGFGSEDGDGDDGDEDGEGDGKGDGYSGEKEQGSHCHSEPTTVAMGGSDGGKARGGEREKDADTETFGKLTGSSSTPELVRDPRCGEVAGLPFGLGFDWI